jgi:hypothetical protein
LFERQLLWFISRLKSEERSMVRLPRKATTSHCAVPERVSSFLKRKKLPAVTNYLDAQKALAHYRREPWFQEFDALFARHAALVLQRWAHGASKRGEPVPTRLTVREKLEFATVRGAQNAALAHKIGTLTPGKEADIVLVRASNINTLPLTNAVATVASYAHAGMSARCSLLACRANGPGNSSMSTSPLCGSECNGHAISFSHAEA